MQGSRFASSSIFYPLSFIFYFVYTSREFVHVIILDIYSIGVFRTLSMNFISIESWNFYYQWAWVVWIVFKDSYFVLSMCWNFNRFIINFPHVCVFVSRSNITFILTSFFINFAHSLSFIFCGYFIETNGKFRIFYPAKHQIVVRIILRVLWRPWAVFITVHRRTRILMPIWATIGLWSCDIIITSR